MEILVLNGPNLNILGSREPDVYGLQSLSDLEKSCRTVGSECGVEIDFRQTNSETELVDWLQYAFELKKNVILNPAAFTHYSYSLRDACSAVTRSGLKLIEVHISNPHSRESFRQNSVISAVATGVIAGFGFSSYHLAIRQLSER